MAALPVSPPDIFPYLFYPLVHVVTLEITALSAYYIYRQRITAYQYTKGLLLAVHVLFAGVVVFEFLRTAFLSEGFIQAYTIGGTSLVLADVVLLTALAVTVYLSLLGRHGLRRLAEVNAAAAHDAAARLAAAGVSRLLAGPFFNEFVVRAPEAVAGWEALAADGVIVGFPLRRWYPELDDALLICVTERHGAEDVDRLVDALAPAKARTRAVRG